MGRYFFHLFNDLDAPDLEGRELPDDATARDVAIWEAREMIAATVRKGGLNLSHRIDVADKYGRLLFTVRYGDAIKIIE